MSRLVRLRLIALKLYFVFYLFCGAEWERGKRVFRAADFKV